MRRAGCLPKKVAMFTGLSIDAVTGTEAAVFEGQSGIEAGLADELINASDAISVITALNSNVRGRHYAAINCNGSRRAGTSE